MSDNGTERKRVNLYVSEQQKERWDNAVAESDTITGLSTLVRSSVEAYIRNDTTDDSSTETGSTTVNDPQLLDGINAIQSQLSDLDDRMLAVESQLSKAQPELKDVMSKVFEVLPTAVPGTEVHTERKNVAEIDGDSNVVWSGEVADIAELLSIDRTLVRTAVEKLSDESSRVQSQRFGETPVYWKDMGKETGYEELFDQQGD